MTREVGQVAQILREALPEDKLTTQDEAHPMGTIVEVKKTPSTYYRLGEGRARRINFS